MKLCCFIKDGETRIGYRGETGVADLTAAGINGGINELIAGGEPALAAAREIESKKLLPETPEELIQFDQIAKP
ncbi:MAG: hypothetical protein FWG32_09700, partial [Oscillospiraceae bacterium]|nr:hypothetical protein [Oscillospiraceae bacterium]